MLTSCVFEKNGQIFSKAFLNQKNKILLNFQTIDTFAYPYDLNITSAYNVVVRYSRLIMRLLSDPSRSHYARNIFPAAEERMPIVKCRVVLQNRKTRTHQ